jgi:hypothetical protein
MCHLEAEKRLVFHSFVRMNASYCLPGDSTLYGSWIGLFIDRRKNGFL